MDFERAAQLRDRIRAMSHIQSRQGINPTTFNEADVFALHREGGANLHPGVLLPRRTELGQPALLPAPRRRVADWRSAGSLSRPVL